jgi:hypothetical protein
MRRISRAGGRFGRRLPCRSRYEGRCCAGRFCDWHERGRNLTLFYLYWSTAFLAFWVKCSGLSELEVELGDGIGLRTWSRGLRLRNLHSGWHDHR